MASFDVPNIVAALHGIRGERREAQKRAREVDGRELPSREALGGIIDNLTARSVDEVLLCYPGVLAMIHHRVAHQLYRLRTRFAGLRHAGAGRGPRCAADRHGGGQGQRDVVRAAGCHDRGGRPGTDTFDEIDRLVAVVRRLAGQRRAG